MSTQPTQHSNGFRPDPDLVDRIAAALPAEIRADYYREMRHCRLLPENDEMLRILKIMQFLTLLMEQVPSRVAEEREQLGRMLAESLEAAERTQQTNLAYYRGLEARIAQLPKAIEQGISPEAIAARINEAIRQQFAQTGLPDTAKALGLLANQVKQSTKDFQQTASELTGTYNGVAAQASRGMETMVRSVDNAAHYSKHAQEKLAGTFLDARRWLIYTAASVALALGLVLGFLLGWHLQAPTPAAVEVLPAPTVQAVPEQPAVPSAPAPKPIHRKRAPDKQAQQDGDR